jgi:glycosyltransferase involved in cell wall biosynthesis
MTRGISLEGISAIRQMRKIFKREKFDLVQYATPNASCYASIAAKQAKVPVRLYAQWGLIYISFSGWKRKLFKAIEKMVCRKSTWVEPICYDNLKFAHEEGLYPEEKGSVVWNGSACGVDLKKYDITKKQEYRKAIREKLNIPESAFVFGFMGRITRDKGVNELFAAFRKIAEKDPNVYLIICGRSEVTGAVNRENYDWARSSSQVVFTGFITETEQYYSAMDCYMTASYREGFGETVVEAGAMGIPTIVTNIPGPGEAMVKDQTGLVIERKSTEQLYDAMVKMKESPELREEFSKNGHEFVVSHFDRKVHFAKTLEDRKKLLEKK